MLVVPSNQVSITSGNNGHWHTSESARTGILWLVLRKSGQTFHFHWSQRTIAFTSIQVTCLVWWQLGTHDTPKAHYQQLYYEALVNTISCLKDQFNQPGYNIYCNLEELLMKASMKEDFNELFRSFCDFYQKDFNYDLLEAHLLTFGVNFQYDTISSGKSTQPTI